MAYKLLLFRYTLNAQSHTKPEMSNPNFVEHSFYIFSPAASFIWPYFFRRIADTVMNPVVSAGEKSPISSMLDSDMSYSFSVSEKRPRMDTQPL